MGFFSIVLALMLEQVRPLAPRHVLYRLTARWSQWAAHTLDAGLPHVAWATWSAVVLLPAALALLVHAVLEGTLGWGIAMLWNVALLYMTLGFRQFSHHFSRIRVALNQGDDAHAKHLLAQWQRVQVDHVSRSELVRHVIEFSVIAAHRHVFGVFFWYAMLSMLGMGPAGAVAYRLAQHAHASWLRGQRGQHPVSAALLQAAAQAWYVLDWLPARATALGFAMAGSFEDAMDGWRQHAYNRPQDNDGVILSATAGAIHVRLGGAGLGPAQPSQTHTDFTPSPALSVSTAGQAAQVAHLASVVGLVWRSAIMWLVLLALLTMANVMG